MNAAQHRAPPIPNSTSFYLRFVDDISALRDQLGRPLHEVDFRDELSGDEIKRCPYGGSRRGRLMNQSALRIVAGDWELIRAGLRFLVAEVPLPTSAAHGALRTWARSLLPMFVPLYLMRTSALAGRSNVLPTAVSGLFKVMLDVPTTIDLMLIRDAAASERLCEGSYTPGDITAFAEASGVLNNGEWTCAAPPGLIEELLGILTSEPMPSGRCDGAVAHVVDTREFSEFVNVVISQYALTQAFQIATAFVLEQAFRRVGTRDARPSPTGRPSAYETRRRHALGACGDPHRTRYVICLFGAIAECETEASDVRAQLFREMVDTVSCAPDSSAAELLRRQVRIEALLGGVLADLRRIADNALGRDREEATPIDLRYLTEADFPTMILRTALS